MSRTKKGKGESPSSPKPRFQLQEVEPIEVTAAKQVARRKAQRRIPPPKMVTVTLQMRHSINGTFYGPGQVTIKEKDAQRFLNTEHEAIQKELSLTRQEAFIISYGPHGGLVRRQVPWAQFDNILSREELPLNQLPQESRR